MGRTSADWPNPEHTLRDSRRYSSPCIEARIGSAFAPCAASRSRIPEDDTVSLRFPIPRWATILVSLAFVVGAVAFGYPGGIGSLCNDCGAEGGWRKLLSEGNAERQKMDVRAARISDRINFKEEVANALLRGEIEIESAVAQYEEVNRGDERLRETLKHRHGDLDDRRLAARNLQDYLKGRIPSTSSDRDRAEVVASRLKTQLETSAQSTRNR